MKTYLFVVYVDLEVVDMDEKTKDTWKAKIPLKTMQKIQVGFLEFYS